MGDKFIAKDGHQGHVGPANADTINYNQTNLTQINQPLSEEKDLGIIKEIFDFIFRKKVTNVDIEKTKKSGKLTPLKEKITLNFSRHQIDNIDELMKRLWSHKMLVEEFVQTEEEANPGRINALTDKIQSDFRRVKQARTHHEKVEEVDIIEKIALDYLPDNQKSNPDYIGNAKAIMLYFFERCDFGKRTAEEKQKQLSLFDL